LWGWTDGDESWVGRGRAKKKKVSPRKSMNHPGIKTWITRTLDISKSLSLDFDPINLNLTEKGVNQARPPKNQLLIDGRKPAVETFEPGRLGNIYQKK